MVGGVTSCAPNRDNPKSCEGEGFHEMVAKTNTASQIQTLHSNAFIGQSRYGAILQEGVQHL